MLRTVKRLLRCLLRLLYRVEVTGMEHYAKAGKRVLIIANHTSLLDGILLYAWLPETPTFAINIQIATEKRFKPFLRFVDLFTMDPANPLAVKSMIKFLQEDRKAVIFPEGRITTTGILMKVYEGPGLIADKSEAMLLPIAIDGAQYSPFSYMKGRGHIKRFPKIKLTVLPPEKISLPPSLRGHKRRKAAAAAMQNLMNKLSLLCYDPDRTLLDAVLDAAQLFGKNRAVLEDINREPMTYSQLFTRLFILAAAIDKDTRPQEHVGLLLPNVAANLISFLALQCLGRVPAMLNFTGGAQVLLKACETASIKTVYTSRRFIENAALESVVEALAPRVTLIYLEDLRERIGLANKLAGLLRGKRARAHYHRMLRNRDPDQPAVILFTSGSEGVPKGVALSHRNLLSNFAQVRCLIDFLPRDTFFNCLPLFHCFGLNVGCLMPLLGGSKIFLYPTPLHYRLIPELVYGTNASFLFGTDTFLRGYARHAHPYDFHSLRYVLAGAEKLREDTQKIWMEKFGARILQGYGVTECSPVISVNTPLNHKMNSVGKLLPGMEARLAPVPGIETGGRLMVKGDNVMLGYLLHGGGGKLQPPATEQGEGWHDTGDIAAIDEDGYIEIRGRAKRFAKIGGEMISLAAVEELASAAWPGFNHAALARPDQRKGEKIVLATDCEQADRKGLQEKARELQYGELYIPRTIAPVASLPLLGSGKIDYASLTKMIEEGEAQPDKP